MLSIDRLILFLSLLGLFFFVFIMGGIATHYRYFPYPLINAVAKGKHAGANAEKRRGGNQDAVRKRARNKP